MPFDIAPQRNDQPTPSPDVLGYEALRAVRDHLKKYEGPFSMGGWRSCAFGVSSHLSEVLATGITNHGCPHHAATGTRGFDALMNAFHISEFAAIYLFAGHGSAKRVAARFSMVLRMKALAYYARRVLAKVRTPVAA